jgi:glycosyltransferase involved in cell wall biosynthesis
VVFVSEWRKYGGPQKSMLEEIQALTRWGMRVGVAHLEALRFMTTRSDHLCQPVQDLINDGTVDHLLLDDEVETALLVIRYPPVLQFAPSEPSRIRARHVIILANQAPFERDGTDFRYVPKTCTEAARALFAVEPRWCPQGPDVRDLLEPALPPGAVTPFDMPGIIDIDQWETDRSRFRLDRPVIGRHSRDNWAKWPGDRETLLAIYPDTADVEVRVMGGGRVVREVLGTPHPPPNWVVYGYDEIGVRSFLNQLDYYVYFPHPNMVEAFGRAILEALATGCVTILPHHFEATFGDAAVYCHPGEVRDLIDAFHSGHESYVEQSRRARDRVEQLFSHDAYADLISTITNKP